jgi:hypothetical protein
MDWRLNDEGCVDEECSSRRFRTEDNGHIYCDRGHLQGTEQTNRDEDDFEGASHGRTSRRQREEKEKVLKRRFCDNSTVHDPDADEGPQISEESLLLSYICFAIS